MDKETIKEILVPEDIIPCRIDIYLVQIGVGLSRSQIQKSIRNGNIKVRDSGTKPNFILRGGETIIVKIPQEESPLLLPEDIPIEIVYEDEYLLVVNKPPGMVTHPARGNWNGTVLNAVLHHTKQISHIGGDFRPGIVHRLDKNTSGLIIIAKRERIHLKLSDMISKRKISRKYLALLWGHLSDDIVIVDEPIGYNPKKPLLRAVVPNGKHAKTQFTPISRFDFIDIVEAKLFTGRTHQIRVHAQYIGHSVFGDKEYGGREERILGIAPQYRNDAKDLLKIAQRQMLHAWKLSFEHPASSKTMEFKAPIPEDFQKIIHELAGENFVLVR